MKNIHKNIPFEEIPFHLDIPSGGTVFLTSDITNFALKAKANGRSINIQLFIDNFQLVLKEGTLIIPGYTDYLRDNDTFDYQKSKPSTGAISNRVLKREDFTRTFDPLHSVFVWGKEKEAILKLKDESTFGENSIFSFLEKKDCIFIFMDVHMNKSFTFIHYIEEQEKVPYRKYYNWTIAIKNNNETSLNTVRFYSRKPGVVNSILKLHEYFKKNKLVDTYNYIDLSIELITAKTTTTAAKYFIRKKDYFYSFSIKSYIKAIIKKIIGRQTI